MFHTIQARKKDKTHYKKEALRNANRFQFHKQAAKWSLGPDNHLNVS